MRQHDTGAAVPDAGAPPTTRSEAAGGPILRHRPMVAQTGPLLGAFLVIFAALNHVLVDLCEVALSGAVWPATDPARPRRRRGQPRLPAADEFFLHVETDTCPQHVGGVAVLDSTTGPSSLDVARLREHVADVLPGLTRLTRRIEPAGRWRHHHWSEPGGVDLDWHVRQTTLLADGGWPALAGFVADLVSRPLDRHRPLWRMWLVHGLGPGRSAVVVVVHHAVADGLGLITLFRDLLTPPAGPLPMQRPAPGRLARAVTTAAGLTFLASRSVIPAARSVAPAARSVAPASPPFAAPSAAPGPQRRFQAHTWPLPPVRAAARQMNLRVTDLLLAAVGEAVRACFDTQGRPSQNTTLRTAVPRTLRAPSPAGYLGPPGNLTAGLLIDVPLGRMTVRERARRVGEQTGPHATARALAGAAVVRAAGSLPAAAHRRTAQQMYRSPHFDAIVTNMPGPAEPLRLLGHPLCTVHPVVPLADGVPLAVGAMGWNGHYCLSITVDATRLDPAVVGEALCHAVHDLVGRPAQRSRWSGTQHTLDAYEAPTRPPATTDLDAGPATTPDGTA